MKKIWWLVFAVTVIGGGVGLTLSLRNGGETPPVDDEPLVIGHDTTRITQPLTPGGRVDYIAALNAVDVPAPEDNAALPMLRLLGANALVAGDRAAVLTQLGFTQDVFTEGSLTPASDEFDAFSSYDGPLDEESIEYLSEWVAANDVAFENVLAASNCPKLWVPFVRDAGDGSFQRALPVPSITQLSDLLRARAEVRLAKSELQPAWEDVQAILRLYVLADQQRSGMGRIVAAGVRASALDCVARVLELKPPSADLCLEMLKTMQALPRPADIAYDYDVCDRYFVLDGYIEQIARGSGGQVDGINPVLRAFNADLDDFVSHLKQPAPSAVVVLTELVEASTARIKSLSGEFHNPSSLLEHVIDHTQSGGAHLRAVAGQVLAHMVAVVIPLTMERVFDPKRHVVSIALACHLYRLRNGAFPESLEMLVPMELSALPTHDITGNPMPYERTAEGCLVGPRDADAGDYIEMTNN